MSSSTETLLAGLDFSELDIRRADLRDIQVAQAEVLRKEGILTRALFAAAKHHNEPPDESTYWACVYRDQLTNRSGIRFVAYYADTEGELPTYTVYEAIAGSNLPLKPFDEDEMNVVARMIADLEFEQEYGMFPDLTADLTALCEPAVS